jgi:P-type Ca2+ transporter type 2B
MDTFAALALATEPPTEDLYNDKPYSKSESIVNKGMLRNIICQYLYQLTVLFVMLFAGEMIFGVRSKRFD